MYELPPDPQLTPDRQLTPDQQPAYGQQPAYRQPVFINGGNNVGGSNVSDPDPKVVSRRGWRHAKVVLGALSLAPWIVIAGLACVLVVENSLSPSKVDPIGALLRTGAPRSSPVMVSRRWAD